MNCTVRSVKISTKQCHFSATDLYNKETNTVKQSLKFAILMNMQMPTKVGIFKIINREHFKSAELSTKFLTFLINYTELSSRFYLGVTMYNFKRKI